MTNRITITEEESKICKIDGKKFNSSREVIVYTKKQYGIETFEDYIIKCYYNGIRPVCLKTGQKLSFKAHKLGPWFSDTIKNKFNRKPHTKEAKEKIRIGCEKNSMEKFGVKNVFESDWCKEKIKTTNLIKYGVDNPAKNRDIINKTRCSYYETMKKKYGGLIEKESDDADFIPKTHQSTPEIKFQSILENNNIKFIPHFNLDGKIFDFYLTEFGFLVEIDGDFYHASELKDLSIIGINNSVNDHIKNQLCIRENKTLYRLRPDMICEFSKSNLIEHLNKNSYKQNQTVGYFDKIATKEYLKTLIEIRGIEYIEKKCFIFLKFIRTFVKQFPKIECNYTALDVFNSFNKFKVETVLIENVFTNYRCPYLGTVYLKTIFDSYWKSSYKNRKSPVEIWIDDFALKNIIKYRIGHNNSNEIFDFSIHQLIRGISAQRITVSFFNPHLAFSIYKELLGDIESPVVLDPCCGFGGRLLGFKMAYPNGTYYGCEPNVETYNELLKLIEIFDFKDVFIFNKKIEDFNENINQILTFTSIPYFDLENYSNVVEYENLTEWKNTFIKKIETFNNCYINCSFELGEKLNWKNCQYKIQNNRSHFDKNNSPKFEPIYKIL